MEEQPMTQGEILKLKTQTRERLARLDGPLPSMQLAPVPIPKGRLTLVEQICHRAPNAEPASADNHWGIEMSTDAQPYQRRLTIGPEWTSLDCGWADEWRVPGGILSLCNHYPVWQVLPTDEEKARADARIVWVCFLPPQTEEGQRTQFSPVQIAPWEAHALRPGESLRIPVMDLGRVRVKCATDQTKATVTIFPRG
jgi:hypothetical protein